MTPALISTLLGILEKYGPIAYQAAINLFQKPEPSLADLNAVYDAALLGDYNSDITAARDRAEAKAKAAAAADAAGGAP